MAQMNFKTQNSKEQSQNMFNEFKKLKEDTNKYPHEFKKDKSKLEIEVQENTNKHLNEIITIQDMKLNSIKRNTE